MKKSVSLFVVIAIAITAFAAEQKHSWFDLDVGEIGINPSRVWPTDGSDYEAYMCVLTNTAAASFADSRISFVADEPMTVVPEAKAAISDFEYVQVEATVKMEPFLEADVPDVPEGAKTAAIAVISGSATNFWVAAGTDELFWTNTCISADVSEDVNVNIMFNNGADSVVTKWTFNNNEVFTCKIDKVSELHQVAFQGTGEITSCWGDAEQFGNPVHFYLDNVTKDVIVTVTTTNGDVIAKTGIGDYIYLSGGTVNLSFTVPDGWRFFDGALEWNDVITNLEDGGYVPKFDFGWEEKYEGIADIDVGPVNGWMVQRSGEFGSEFVGRFAALDDALAALKDGCGLMACYSESGHTIVIPEDGGAVEIDGETYSAREHYLYINIGYEESPLPMLVIDPEEATITSIKEDETDPTSLSIGSILDTFSGFDYSVIFADDLEFTEDCGETESFKGTGEKLELKAPKGDKGRRFYRIRITD